MSVATSKTPVAVTPQDGSQSNAVTGVAKTSSETPSAGGGVVLDHVNDAALATAYQEDLERPMTPEPQEKGPSSQDPNTPPVEESLDSRLERLGRQRPEVFPSIWAEIGFVFSISMSQVLSVRTSPFKYYAPKGLTMGRNTLYRDSQSSFQPWPQS
jgi:hypothetical protein